MFGGAALYSPSVWINPKTFSDAEGYVPPAGYAPKFYMFAGRQEPSGMVPDNERMAGLLAKKKGMIVQLVTDPFGKHSESTWRMDFHKCYEWLME